MRFLLLNGWYNHSQINRVALPRIILWCLAPVTTSSPQVNIIKYFTITDGLASRAIVDVHRDANGFLWVLSQQDIQRYDGYHFLDYNHIVPDSLRSHLLGAYGFHVDPEGWLWLVEKHGRYAMRFNPLTEERELRTGPLVLPTDSGLRHINEELYPYYDVLQGIGSATEVRQRVDEITRHHPLRTIQRTEDGRIWLHQNQGHLAELNPRTGETREPWHPAPARKKGTWPTIDSNAAFWLPGNDGDLRRIQMPTSILDEQNLHLYLDNEAGIWLVGDDERIFQLNPQTGAFTDHGRLASHVIRFYKDAEGLVWIITDSGLIRLEQRPRYFTTVGARELPGKSMVGRNSMRGLVELAHGGYLAFNDLGECMRIDEDGTNETFSPQLDNASRALVHGLCVDSTGRVWVLIDGTLYQMDRTGAIVGEGHAPADARIVSIFSSKESKHISAFLADGRGYLFNTQSGLFEFPLPKCKEPPMAALMSADRLILPDEKGLRIVYLPQGRFQTVDLGLEKPLAIMSVRGIIRSGGHICMGTNAGILCVDTTEWRLARRISAAEGLADPVVYGLLAEHGRLWAGTRNGLSLVHPSSGRCVNFRMEDGLPSNEFNTGPNMIDSKGRCWMGGTNGLVRFNPFEISNQPRGAFELHWVRLLNLDDRVHVWSDLLRTAPEPLKGITLAPHARTLYINFALTSFADPAAHHYMYYMEGLERPWSNTDNVPDARYLLLPPGTYRFHARAFDHRGIQALNDLAIPIHVPRVWYFRNWAIATWCVILLSIVLFIVRSVSRSRREKAEVRRIEELNAFKDRFFTNVAHEFRTPLTVISGLAGRAELSGPGSAGDITREKALVILRNAKRLLSLVDQLLDLARLRHGRLDLEERPANIKATLCGILADHAPHAEMRGLRLETNLQGASRNLVFDAERLRQIIDNLIGNAIKFTPRNGVVHVTATIGDDDPCTVIVVVQDNGPGIAPEDQVRIMERFYQGADANASGGAGIGLALAKELLEAMGGTIAMESRLGEGSKFTLRVRFAVAGGTTDSGAAIEPGAIDEPMRAIHEDQEEAYSKPLLLVVEDEPDLLDFIEDCLSADYRVLRAVDGAMGFSLAREQVPDLVLSDVMMPGMDGFALCHALKTTPETSHIPVALLTARDDKPSRLEGILRGADAYLVKPFDERELLGVLRNMHRLIMNMQDHFRQQFGGGYSAQKELHPVGMSDPTAAPSPPQGGSEHRFLHQVRYLLELHHSEPGFGVEALAEKLNLSRSQLFRKVKALTGKNPIALLREYRLTKAHRLLQQGGLTVSEVAYASGFNSASYFSDVYFQIYGKRPSEDTAHQ